MATNEEIFDRKQEGIPKELFTDFHAFRQYCLELMEEAREAGRKEEAKKGTKHAAILGTAAAVSIGGVALAAAVPPLKFEIIKLQNRIAELEVEIRFWKSEFFMIKKENQEWCDEVMFNKDRIAELEAVLSSIMQDTNNQNNLPVIWGKAKKALEGVK